MCLAGLRKHDVCFLITVQAKMSLYDQFDWSRPFVPQVGLTCVRGCEVEGMLDEHGRVIEEGPDPKPQLKGTARSFRVWLDTNQYQQDMASVVQGGEVSSFCCLLFVVCCCLCLLFFVVVYFFKFIF